MNILTVLACTGLAAIIATMITLVIVYRGDTDITDYLDQLNVAQEEDAARANRLYLDLEQTKERINTDLVEHTKRLSLYRTGQVQLEKRIHKLELQKDHSS